MKLIDWFLCCCWAITFTVDVARYLKAKREFRRGYIMALDHAIDEFRRDGLTHLAKGGPYRSQAGEADPLPRLRQLRKGAFK